MERAEWAFAPEVEQVAVARRYAQDVVMSWGLPSEDAVLVVSELAANAVQHAQSVFTLRLIYDEPTLVVEVTDTTPEPVPTVPAPPTKVGGYGLSIVARLAKAWGTRPSGDGGKTVWARLDVRT
jgi:anti-sigma regulatory factor (Ser/Thr protein kinase)